jgi:YbbR domain-containing protein
MAYHPFRHLGLKFLSVTVAFGLWFTLAGEESVERSLRVPLETQNRPEQLVPVESAPTEVYVRVRGRTGLLSQLGQGDVLAMLDLSAARAGRRYFSLTRDHVRVPFGVEVVEVSPANITMKFEGSETRQVPVVASVEGEAAPGYSAGKATVEPTTVEISGPASAIQRIKDVATEPVSVAGARATVQERVTIGVPDASVKLDQGATAVVTVPVAPLPVERILGRVPVHLRNAGKGLTAQAIPAGIAITARGPSDVVTALHPDSIAAFVDLAGLGPGRYNLSVRVEPGQGFVVIGTDPSTVAVRIK